MAWGFVGGIFAQEGVVPVGRFLKRCPFTRTNTHTHDPSSGDDIVTVWEVAGDQMFGATAGEIISPMNAVFSTLLLAGRYVVYTRVCAQVTHIPHHPWEGDKCALLTYNDCIDRYIIACVLAIVFMF